MKEKTAIDVIYEMNETIKGMSEKINLLEQTVKILNSKVDGKITGELLKEVPPGVPASAPPKSPPPPKSQVSASKAQNTKAWGKVKDSTGKAVLGAEVAIVDSNNKVIKQTKTNKAGRYMTFLPPGNYSLEIMKEGLPPKMKTFRILEGQNEIEIE